MGRRVAVVGYAQSRHQYDMPKTREDMVFEVAREAIRNARIHREDIDSIVTASSDFLDGRTISNMFLCMAVGAHMKDESKVEEDGAMAMQYGMMKILTGSADVVLVEAHTQSWVFNPHQVSFYTLDPLLDRQIGLINDISAAALQARMYMDNHGATAEQLAMVSVKNLSNAALNPNAHRRMPGIGVQEVLGAEPYYEPITELMFSPLSDGACALILASENKARDITDRPVWIEGVGNRSDGYLRDRNLAGLDSLKLAAEDAYGMAGISDPVSQLDVAEISERYAHEELMMYEALGLCPEGRGAMMLESGATQIGGKMPVNPSGGALAADPLCATGLVRVVEACKQLRGEAGLYQVPGATRALAHGQFGICAQKNIVYILGSEA